MTTKYFREFGKELADRWHWSETQDLHKVNMEGRAVCLLAYIAKLLQPINAHYVREDKKREEKKRRAHRARLNAIVKLTRGPKNPPMQATLQRMIEWEMGWNVERKGRPVKLPTVEELWSWAGFGKVRCEIYERWLRSNNISVEA